MSLAIFDLDRTLLTGDSDHAWGDFLVERNRVDGDYYKHENDRFYESYKAGELDIHEYLAFVLRPLAAHDLRTLEAWRREFVRHKVSPMITPAARALVQKHRDAGHTLIIITSTIDFVASPIAAEFSVSHLLATEAELVDGRYTGRVAGTPCYRHGKVERLRSWVQQHGETLAGSWAYSDSHNDLPLLELVEHPVAVDPDPVLREHAQARGWPILALR
ncbi:MAG: HAD family hydrolase [Acidiferrobacterales bacterium]